MKWFRHLIFGKEVATSSLAMQIIASLCNEGTQEYSNGRGEIEKERKRKRIVEQNGTNFRAKSVYIFDGLCFNIARANDGCGCGDGRRGESEGVSWRFHEG